jgi:hypothetical protein
MNKINDHILLRRTSTAKEIKPIRVFSERIKVRINLRGMIDANNYMCHEDKIWIGYVTVKTVISPK